MIESFDALWSQARPAFHQDRTWRRARLLALSNLVCLGRHTVTGMLTTSGQQFRDWSASYRLFERDRFETEGLFSVARRRVVELLERKDPFVAAMDDTLLPKRGRKVAGAGWFRDPLGPRFQCNLTWAQRFVQISAALPAGKGPSWARMIPMDLWHCPKPDRPSRKASPEVWKAYERTRKKGVMSRVGVKRLKALREGLDQDPGGWHRQLICAVDGSYTNEAVLKNLPERTTLIGRIRKDAKLYALPEESQGTGRPRSYGERLPTPEELRKDERVPWIRVRAWAAGKIHDFQIKTIAPVRWRTAGQDKDLRLVVIRPLKYRLSLRSRTLYRRPTYLICTDSDLSLQELLQYYLWRWEMEVNFRDEKSLLGAGEAQVRNPQAVEKVPALIVASYAMLLLAARAAWGAEPEEDAMLPEPKWRKNKPRHRASTARILNHLRTDLWGHAIDLDSFSGFVTPSTGVTNPEQSIPHLPSALLYAAT